MSTPITVQITPEGILIPRAALADWLEQGIEVVKDQTRIIIQPQSYLTKDHEQIKNLLAADGLLAKFDWESELPSISDEEFAVLREKFSAGKPLSEIVLEERETGED
jgi:hypothetical protein